MIRTINELINALQALPDKERTRTPKVVVHGVTYTINRVTMVTDYESSGAGISSSIMHVDECDDKGC